MVLTRCNPRLAIDNNLNGLCELVDEQMGLETIVEQMIQKMQLVFSIFKTLLENVEQAQKKQRKVYTLWKGLQLFIGFEEEGGHIKMQKLGKKKNLAGSWEGLYIFVGWKDGKGAQQQDEGGQICIIKDFDDKHCERTRKDL